MKYYKKTLCSVNKKASIFHRWNWDQFGQTGSEDTPHISCLTLYCHHTLTLPVRTSPYHLLGNRTNSLSSSVLFSATPPPITWVHFTKTCLGRGDGSLSLDVWALLCIPLLLAKKKGNKSTLAVVTVEWYNSLLATLQHIQRSSPWGSSLKWNACTKDQCPRINQC